MHVAFVIDGLGSGGAQRQVVELAVRLRRRGDIRCSVLVYHRDDFFAARLREGDVPLVRLRKRLRVDPLLPWRIQRWLRAARVDVVHAFLLYPSLWALLAVRVLPRARRPIFLAAERSSLIAVSPATSAVQRFVYRASDAITVNSRAVVDEIGTKLGVPREHLHFLPNGIDLEHWDGQAREDCPLGLEPGRFHLALIGDLRGPEKGHLVLVRALEKLGRERVRDWRVWCIGARTYGPRAARQIEEAIEAHGLGDVVRLEAPVRNVAALMRGLDAVVLPSLFEGFPNVVLEAMASRLPVVATAVGEIPTLVQEGSTGFLARTGDPASLAEALARLASLSPEARRVMGERGRALVEARYEMGGVAEAYLALYARLLGDGGSVRPRHAGGS